MSDKMQLQTEEFNAVDRLSRQWGKLAQTPIVDDDYPRVRRDYEHAVEAVIKAFIANGRKINA